MDVDKLQALYNKIKAGYDWNDFTDEEKDYWSGTIKGAYNASDLNRVGEAVLYLQGVITGYGISVTVFPKTDWTEGDAPTSEEQQTYLDNVAAIRSVLFVPQTTPEVPMTMDGFTYTQANNIEKILVNVSKLLDSIPATFRHCGAAVCGGGGLLIR